MIKCHRLRRKPLDQFVAEDLRIMIGQQIGLQYLLPRAIALLSADPLTEGDFYPGDLLKVVLRANNLLLTIDPAQAAMLTAICRSALAGLNDTALSHELTDAIKAYLARRA